MVTATSAAEDPILGATTVDAATPRCIRLRSSTPIMVHRDLSMAAGVVSEMSRKCPLWWTSTFRVEESESVSGR